MNRGVHWLREPVCRDESNQGSESSSPFPHLFPLPDPKQRDGKTHPVQDDPDFPRRIQRRRLAMQRRDFSDDPHGPVGEGFEVGRVDAGGGFVGHVVFGGGGWKCEGGRGEGGWKDKGGGGRGR